MCVWQYYQQEADNSDEEAEGGMSYHLSTE